MSPFARPPHIPLLAERGLFRPRACTFALRRALRYTFDNVALPSSNKLMSSAAAPAPVTGPGGFRVRAARRGDADGIAALLAELGYPGSGDTQTVHWVISHPEMEIYVAGDSHDRPIGVLTLSHRPQLRMKGRIATIDELVVSASWRRKGVGRELVKRAVERAKVLSVKRLELLTHATRADFPKAFYESCGFVEVDAAVLRMPALDFRR